MKQFAIFVCFVSSLAACGSNKATPEPSPGESAAPPTPTTTRESEPTPKPVKPPIEADTNKTKQRSKDKIKPKEEGDCMKNCLRRNMARAVSADAIQRDCEIECGDTQTPKQ